MLVWVVFAGFAVLGTVAVAVVAEITDSLLQAVASAPMGELANAALSWTPPPWLSLWLDPIWVEHFRAGVAATLSGLSLHLPGLSGWLGWLVPAIWVAWLVLVVLALVLAMVLLWLAGQASMTAPRQSLKA